MPVTEITSESQFNEFLHNTNNIHTATHLFVDFYAEWCGPCKRVAPFIHKLSERYPSVAFLKVDVDGCDSLAAKYEVRAMPTFLVFTVGNSKASKTIVGADTKKIEDELMMLTTTIKPSEDF